MNIRKTPLAVAIVAALAATGANAAFIDMTGDFVLTSISTDGTLGRGGTVDPGLRHDPDGTATFPDAEGDYLTPGTPWEMFSVRSDQTGLVSNNNSSSAGLDDGFSSTTLTDVSGSSAFDQAVLWEGTLAGVTGGTALSISHLFYFNDGDERINIDTTITAMTDLTGVSFARGIDPDPDVDAGGSFSTINSRGLPSASLPVTDFVGAEGPLTGLTLGLFSQDALAHNTGIDSGWSEDPLIYLGGEDDGNGDWTIGIAFDIGDLMTDETVSFSYAYVMGDTIDTVFDGDVPVPATLALFGAGLLGAGAARRRHKD